MFERAVSIGDCLEFGGKLDRAGYGRIWFRGREMIAHRVAYILANGEIPDGLMVCHRCDNPACINARHLFLGTARDNVLDMVAKGRGRNQNADKTACPKGHPYSDANTYINPRGARECRTCKRATRNRARDLRTKKKRAEA